VMVARQQVGVEVTRNTLRVGGGLLWYSAAVGVQLPPSLRGQARARAVAPVALQHVALPGAGH
jgi:hypothetical protein